jgi:inorganic triphosphatase YgiF
LELKGTDKTAEPETAINREIELKLRASPEAVGQLLAAPLLASGIPGLASAQSLDAAYYDTADLQLQKRGVSLRVRKEGDRFIQTVKTGGAAAGAFDRHEWDTVVPDLNPRPDWVMESTARALLGHLAPDELTEVCRTCIERETRVVGHPYDGKIAIIEIAFDRGTLEAGERAEPVAEVELELLKGNTRALYSLALTLHDIAPLQVEVRSKAERGYELFTGKPPQWHKAKKLRFSPGSTVEGGIAAVFESCFDHWMANEPATLDGSDPEGLHQMRVGLRRMRSALTLFDGVLPMMQAGWLKKECQWITRTLGSARNWDVFLDEVLAPLEANRPGDASLAALRDQCERARARNYETAREAIRSPRYTTLVLNFSRWLDEADWRATENTTRREILAAPLKAYADTVLEQRYRRLVKRGRGLASATAKQRHKLRIAVKKMRYTAEFFASLYGPKKSGAMIRELSGLQDTLGDLNDLAVTERQLETVIYQAVADPAHDDIIKGVGLVVGWSTARAKRGEVQLLDEWQRFKQLKPFWKRTRKR